jgi:hypothetical protein
MKKELIKFHVLANLFFASLLLIIFRDFFFNLKTLLVTSDHLHSLGMRYIRDGFFLSQWDPSRLGGLPTLDATYGDSYHPLVILHSIFDPARALGYKFILCIQIAFATSCLLFYHITNHKKFTLLLSLFFALCPEFVSLVYPGHDGKMMVISIVPLAILGIRLFINESQIKGLLLIIFSIIWSITSSHLQMAYFFLWGIGFYSLFMLYFKNKIKHNTHFKFGILVITLLIGVGISSIQIIPPYKYTTEDSVRGSDKKTTIAHATSWSSHIQETYSMVLPEFSGDLPKTNNYGYLQTYWGHNAFKLNSNALGTGLLAISAICLILGGFRNKENLFWFVSIFVSLTYSLGVHTHFFSLFYELIPGVNKFRAPSMVLFWIPIALSVIIANNIKDVLNVDITKIRNIILFYSALVTSSLIVFFNWNSISSTNSFILVLIVGLLINLLLANNLSFPLSLKPLKHISKKSLILWNIPFFVFLSACFREHILFTTEYSEYFKPTNNAIKINLNDTIIQNFITIQIILTFLFFFFKSKSNKVFVALALVSSIELIKINKPFIQVTQSGNYIQLNNPLISAIKKDFPDSLNDFRILCLSKNPAINANSLGIFGLRSATGYHDNELKTYNKFRGGTSSSNLIQSLQSNPYLDIANVGYIIFNNGKQDQIFKNINAFSRLEMFFNSKYEKESLFQEYSKTLSINDSAIQTIQNLQPNQKASINIIEKSKGDYIKAKIHSTHSGQLFFSENFHSNWNAYVNGEKTPISKAFNSFQAINIPKGESNVEFVYKSKAVEFSKIIILLSILFLIIMVIVLKFYPIKKK